MRIDSFNVYEPPVAEEVKLIVESPIAESGNMENPNDPGQEGEIDIN